jgi:hypothetical protein
MAATGSSSFAAVTTGTESTADGDNACATTVTPTAVTCVGAGTNVPSNAQASTVLGYGATATHNNQTFIGSPGSTVQTTILGVESHKIGNTISVSGTNQTIAPPADSPVMYINATSTPSIQTITPTQACVDTGFSCRYTFIAVGAFTFSTGGNIYVASTISNGTFVDVQYIPADSLWFASK